MSKNAPTSQMYRSPDEQHTVEFRCAGEVQMSALYFHVIVDDQCLGNRIFGDICVWSPDGRYVALQQWLSTDRTEGPETQLLVVDARQRTECILGRAKGFVTPLAFNDRSIAYRRVGPAGQDDQQEQAFPACEKWRSLDVGEADRPWADGHCVLAPIVFFVLWALPCLLCLVFLGAAALVVWLLLR